MDPHTGFIAAAFAITAAVMAGLVAAILLDYRTQLRLLAHLSAQRDPRPGAAPEGRPDDDA